MVTKVVLCILAVLCLEAALVNSRGVQRRSPLLSLTDREHLNTNAARFAAGLPPLPPVIKKRSPTRVEAARRATPSLLPRSGNIQIEDPSGKALGYLSKNLEDGHFTLSTKSDANIFSTYVHASGETQQINLKDTNKNGYALAAIMSSEAVLGDPYAFAILGDSLPTRPGDEPKYDTHPTVFGMSETAIWTYVASSGRLKPYWVNSASYSRSTKAYIFYDSHAGKFYLSNTRSTYGLNGSISEVTLKLV